MKMSTYKTCHLYLFLHIAPCIEQDVTHDLMRVVLGNHGKPVATTATVVGDRVDYVQPSVPTRPARQGCKGLRHPAVVERVTCVDGTAVNNRVIAGLVWKLKYIVCNIWARRARFHVINELDKTGIPIVDDPTIPGARSKTTVIVGIAARSHVTNEAEMVLFWK